MGTFYRSRHELVFVFKNGDGAHTNTFELGQHGRYRTNVWEYAGVNTFRAGRLDELAMHPTVKPVAMLADAIRDVTRRGALVLDPFAGSGSTLIAAEKTGRQARCIEYEPRYCDVIVRRWQAYTGKMATFEGTDLTFEDFEGARSSAAAQPPAPQPSSTNPTGSYRDDQKPRKLHDPTDMSHPALRSGQGPAFSLLCGGRGGRRTKA